LNKEPLVLIDVFPELSLIGDPDLREKVEAVWQQIWQAAPWESIEEVPTSPDFPYPHIAHNRSVLAMALAVADAFEKFHNVTLDRDVLLAAGLLQDVSKLVEYDRAEDGTIIHSDLGKSYPHAFWAAHVALEHGLPDTVCSIILDHTPQSARFPSTLEGKILYYVDQLDVLAIYKDRWRKELFITK
jgi:HD domain